MHDEDIINASLNMEERKEEMYSFLITAASTPTIFRHMSANTQMNLIDAIVRHAEEVLQSLGYDYENTNSYDKGFEYKRRI